MGSGRTGRAEIRCAPGIGGMINLPPMPGGTDAPIAYCSGQGRGASRFGGACTWSGGGAADSGCSGAAGGCCAGIGSESTGGGERNPPGCRRTG
jgi:hypothetical protein